MRRLDLFTGLMIIVYGLINLIDPISPWGLVLGICFLIVGICFLIIAFKNPQLLHKPIFRFRK